jgi:RHS repeat-associated protein
MAQPGPDNPTGRTPSENVPAIRTFQFDGGDLAEPGSGVNLFRGTLTYPLELVALPGRSGLDVSVGALYDGAIGAAVETWNLDRPTGTMGLGWLPTFEGILVDNRGSSALPGNRYVLVTGERATPLQFDGGRDARGWLTCQTQPHAFWSVAYDPASETWEVVHTDGTTYRYGGKDSGRATVQWGVSWGAWIGSSSQPAGQQRYAIGWNLAEIENMYGDKVTYGYTSVEQNVGFPGSGYKSYTKASYLSTITDVFGRQVAFGYQDKTYDLAQGVCEYADPRRKLTSAAQAIQPDAYQSRYETRYLDRLDVTGVHGEALFTMRFAYDVRNLSSTPTSSPAYPFLAKRFLVGVTMETPAGDTLPGYTMEYYGRTQGSGAAAALPGALRRVTYPAGGQATYTYERQEVAPAGGGDPRYPLRERVDCPLTQGAAPRVWFGPDYTVVTWYSAATQSLMFSTYRWLGRWVEYRAPQTYTANVVDSSLRVLAQADFFCLTWTDSSGRQVAQLYRKDPEEFGSWVLTDADEALTAAGGATLAAAGDDFVMFCNPDHAAGPFWGWRWAWQSRSWVRMTALPSLPAATVPRYTLAAQGSGYVAASYVPGSGGSQGTLTLAHAWQDATQPVGGGWQTPVVTSASLTVHGAEDAANDFYLLLSPAETGVAATYITAVVDQPQSIDYAVRVFNWDATQRFTQGQYTRAYSSPASGGEALLPVLATVVAGSTLGNSGNLLRYAGGVDAAAASNWVAHDRPGTTAAGMQFAYGPDVALVADATGQTDVLVTFDPAVPSTGGFAERNMPAADGPPSISGGYLCLGSAVYSDVAGANWSRLAQALPSGDVATLSNRGPSYLVYDEQGSTGVEAVFLRNGDIGPSERFDDVPQRISTGLPAQPGTLLAGANTFVTYPSGTDLDGARTLYLYRIVGRTATGPVYATPLVSVAMTDPAGLVPAVERTFSYDETTVVYDPDNEMTRYSKVTARSVDPAVPQGSTVQYFSNGVSTDGSAFYPSGVPVNYQNLLTGQLLRREVYDAGGTLVAATTLTHSVSQTAAPSPGANPVYVAGAWARLVKQDEDVDGVRRSTGFTYSPFSGLETSRESDDYDASGAHVTLRATTVYGYEVAGYQAWMLARNALAVPVQVTSATDSTVVAVEATTWKLWEAAAGANPARWALAASFRWSGTGSPAFDFSSQTTPPGWLEVTRVLARDADGLLATEQSDVDGVVTSTVFDRLDMNPVATFPNASVQGGEAAYYGFEPGERNPGWAPQSGGGALDVVTDGAHTGSSYLRLPGGGDGVQLERSPADASRPYLFTSWVRTPVGYTGGAAWQASVLDASGAQVWDATAPFPGTEGRWQQLALVIDLPTGATGPLTVRLRGTNTGSTDAFADDLRFSPLECAFAARVYDQTGLVTLAELGPRGEVERYAADCFRRPRARTDASGRPSWVGDRFLRVPGGTPQAGSRVDGYPAAGGVWEDFSSSDLSVVWDAAGAGAWVVDVASRHLRHAASAAPETLAMRAQVGAGLDGVQVEVLPPAQPTSPVGVTLGPATVRWDPAGCWQLCDSTGAVLATADEPVLRADDWLLVGAGDTLLFFYGGRQVFQHDLATAVTGACALTAKDEIVFGPVVAFSNVSAGIDYLDGFSRSVQAHVYGEDGWTARATLYDALGRQVAGTKPVPRPAGAFGYWQDLVTNVDLDGTGTVGGAVAAYYGPGGGGPSDDGGYPFQRSRFEASALGRPLEQGLPGTAFAIDPAVAEADRHTQRFSYGPSVALGGLAAGTCYQRDALDPNGNRSAEITNAREQVLVRLAWLAGAATPLRSTLSYTPSGQLAEMTLPYDPASSAGQTLSVTYGYDFFGRQVTLTTPDLGVGGNDPGTTRTMYDQAGRVRFRQTPGLAAAGDIAYFVYDRLGRAVEEGLVAFDWDSQTQAQLQQYADGDAWPAQNGRWRRRYTYGASADDMAALLRLTVATSRSADSGQQIVESYTYDLEGRVTARSLQAPEFDGVTRTVGFVYDGLDRILQVTQSGGGHEFTAYYTLDRLGLVAAIGTTAGASDLATFTYNADSTIAGVDLAANTPAQQTFGYNSPAWVTALAADAFSQGVRYAPSQSAPGYYDGSPAQVDDQEHWDATPGTVQRIASYDALTRLVGLRTSASGAGDTDETISYDARGNILEVTSAATSQYDYEPGTNRVRNTDGSTGAAYGYDLDGNVTGAPGERSLTYEPMTGLPATIATTNGPTVTYRYDASGARVLRLSSGGGATLSVPGGDDTVLATWDAQGPTFLVYGPTGLVASCHPSQGTRFYLKDHLGSVRVVIDGGGAVVAAYRYSAWGDVTAAVGSLEDSPFLYAGYSYESDVGLYYCRARMYDPSLRRFYGLDPASEFASPYLYAANSPLRFVDPTGRLAALAIALLIGLVVGAVAGLAAGIATSVQQKWSVGEAIWRTLLFTVVGAATGVLFAAAGYGAGAVATSVTANAFLQGVVRGGLMTVASVGLGAAGGATNSAIAKGDPALGAEAGALTGLVTGIVGSALSEGITAVRVASGTTLTAASRIRPDPLGDFGLREYSQTYSRATLFKGAAIQVAGGAIKGAVGGVIATGLEVARGHGDWDLLLQDVLLGATIGALWSSAAPIDYVQYGGRTQVILSPNSAIGNAQL